MNSSKLLFARAWSSISIALMLGATVGPVLAQTSPDAKAELSRVIAQMDRTAANFHTTQANFVWTQYTKVVADVTDTQKGTVYFRRSGSQVEMAADVNDPAPPKYVLFTGSRVQVYQPKIDQVTQYDTGKDRAAFESFLAPRLWRQRARHAQVFRRELPWWRKSCKC